MSYATVQAIREGAGLLTRVQNEKATGTVDGSNDIFTVRRRPIVDSDHDDKVTTDDVHVFVNGTAVVIESVDADEGTVTLETAPANGTVVTIDYCYSPITDSYTSGKQQEADSWIDMKLKGYVSVPLDKVPGIISTVAELYAAGLILTRDWGNRTDTELTSKDGYQKIKLARELLEDYIKGIEEDKQVNNTGGVTDSSVITDSDVFPRAVSTDCDPYDPTNDDFFMRRQC